MSRTLYAFHNKEYKDADAAVWQAAQVSTVSVTNFLGRIFIGKLALLDSPSSIDQLVLQVWYPISLKTDLRCHVLIP